VIVCQKYTGVPYKVRGKEFTRDARSDQFMFTRGLANSANGFGTAPITPIDNTTFSSASKTQMTGVQAIRVWYGHVAKTDDAGTAATDLNTPGRNQYANQWALGRHALFLVDSASTPTINNYSTGATAASTLTGNVASGAPLYKGYTDVAYVVYTDKANPTGFFGVFDTNPLDYMFTGSNRLWCNPFPKIDPTSTATWVTAGQVAQMHPLLMDNISDFIVEFAADAVPDADLTNDDALGFDGEPDRDPTTKELIWYGLATNIDTNSKGPPPWDPRMTGLDSPVVVGANATKAAYVFRHGAANAALWPYMIRIRYRIHDTRAQLAGDPSPEPGDTSNAGRWFEQIIKVRRE